MRFTILGKYGPFPAAGGACSGYLLEQNDTKVLIDCGSGVLSRLQQICDIRELKAIVLSHLHSDHMADMLILRYALEIWKARGLYSGDPLPVYLPEYPEEIHRQISSAPVFQPIFVKDGFKADIGGVSFIFREMTHPVQSFAMTIESGGQKLVYTGDTNMNPHLEAFARGADMMVADTGLLERDKTEKSPHLSAAEVGRIAAGAEVRKLILSHIWPGYAEEELLQEAAASYDNPIIAEEMKTYII
ncbi:MAG TPA: MBL fold metallo-hydrolase [Clostridiales bacterium]|nr:MBL fold metallo-hydrolase [Clostridiales bacterium]